MRKKNKRTLSLLLAILTLVDRGKVNDFNDLKGVSMVAWNLIFVFYKAG